METNWELVFGKVVLKLYEQKLTNYQNTYSNIFFLNVFKILFKY